ncbi:MAG: pilus assembly protein PilP [Herbaspirillum sp.]
MTTLFLTGCGDGGVPEIQQWMSEVREQTHIAVPKLSEPKKFIPFLYQVTSPIDPYSPKKLAIALAKSQASAGGGLKPDMERRRDPLESYPLDSLHMVGTLQRSGVHYALLQADKLIVRVKVGSYIGQNFGMITKISDTEVDLKEIVQDSTGDWVERPAKLELQETRK